MCFRVVGNQRASGANLKEMASSKCSWFRHASRNVIEPRISSAVRPMVDK